MRDKKFLFSFNYKSLKKNNLNILTLEKQGDGSLRFPYILFVFERLPSATTTVPEGTSL